MATNTINFNLKKAEPSDYHKDYITHENENLDVIDSELKKAENHINNGEAHVNAELKGKISKNAEDISNLKTNSATKDELNGVRDSLFSGDYNDLENTPLIPQVIDNLISSFPSAALSANQGKILNSYISALEDELSEKTSSINDLHDQVDYLDDQASSLASSINEINTRLNNLGFKTGVASYTGFESQFVATNTLKKQGKMCIFNFNYTQQVFDMPTITIPEGFRPKEDTKLVYSYMNLSAYRQEVVTYTLGTNGVITFSPQGNTVGFTIINAGWEIA